MALLVRNLFFGLVGMMVTVRAGAQTRVGESNLRRPLTQMQAAGVPQSTVEDELYAMSAQSGVIFAGQVLTIKQHGDVGMGVGWVEVEFRVEDAIRGCVAGATYELREWAGLWAGGAQRYRVGQRLLMMLHAPGASGLSSPVGGLVGAIPITGSGAAPKPGDTFVGQGEQAVDLRWIQARLLRSTTSNGGTSSVGARSGGLHASPEAVYVGRKQESLVTRKTQVPEARNNLGFASTDESGTLGVDVNPPSSSALAGRATLGSVLAILGAWEAQQANAAQ